MRVIWHRETCRIEHDDGDRIKIKWIDDYYLNFCPPARTTEWISDTKGKAVITIKIYIWNKKWMRSSQGFARSALDDRL